MAGYIGARSVTLNTTVATAQDVTATDTTPEVTIINNTHEDSDGGREGKLIFKGQQSGGEESTLAEIEAHHSGSADDEKSNLIFRTNDGSDGASPTEAMRIDSAQNIAIGTTAPTTFSGFKTHHFKNGSGDAISLVESDGGVISQEISADSTGVTLGSRSNHDVRITTNDTERMRINSSGDVLIGITSAPSAGSGGSAFRVDSNGRRNLFLSTSSSNNQGLIYFLNPNGEVGSITTNGSATAYNTSSDYRLKENVSNISDGITRVKQLAPKRFNFIADADTTVDGFLAHEAQTVVPEAITGTKDEVDDDDNPVMQGIDQSKLVPLLTAALQEAIAKIETLETKVAALEAE